MSDRTFYPSFNYGFARVYMSFSFMTNGNSSPLLSTVVGVGLDCITSIIRTAAGTIVVTLGPRDVYPAVAYASVDLDDTPDDGAYATIASVTPSPNKQTPVVFTVKTRAGATTAKTDYGTGGTGAARAVYVMLDLKNSVDSNPA